MIDSSKARRNHLLFVVSDRKRAGISPENAPCIILAEDDREEGLRRRILQLANVLSLYYFSDGTYTNLKREIDKAIHLSELYKPYLIFHGRFDDSNTERLRLTMKECKMDDVFNFDPSCINWEDYLMHTHIPGVVKRLA
ncbi:hypothetical protein BC332_28961 [Capsicum chinense]|nr:hypothetical protein BC332_28961 [Capsicum chinense]